ncbi:MAG: hypothetical protein JO265_02325 [Acidimicrobiia bacterium]|nr:hypothetical protein [Acidimicrobiia bacterium]
MAVEVEQSAQASEAEAGHVARAEPSRRASAWRRLCVAVLLILGTILTPVAVLVTYAKAQVLETDRYVATVKPLASDPRVQSYIADEVTANILSQVDVKAFVTDALPPRAEPLAGPITSSVRGFVHDAVLRATQSAAFQKVWIAANRAAHAQIVKVLTGKGGAVTVKRSGAVKVDLRGLAGAVQKQLDDAGLTIVDKVPVDKIGGSITVFQSKELYSARQGAKVLDAVGYACPFIVVACFGGAVLLSTNKRRAFIKAAFAFALGAIILAILDNGARGLYLHAVAQSVPRGSAAAFYDTMLRSLHQSVRNILLVSVVVFLAAFVAGPARPSVAFRNWWAREVTWAGADADRAGWGGLSASGWVGRHKRLLRIILAALLFVVVFRWSHPTTAVIMWLAVAGLLGLIVIDFYGRQPSPRTRSPVVGGAGSGEG